MDYFLDDRRFHGDILPMNQQPLLLEGALLQVVVPRFRDLFGLGTGGLRKTRDAVRLCDAYEAPPVFHFSRSLERTIGNLAGRAAYGTKP